MTGPVAAAVAYDEAEVRAREALGRASDHLLSLQDAAGWWKGELETNVTMDAEDLLLREFLGIRDEGRTSHAAEWIRAHQRADGTWGNYFGAPGDLSTTVESYAALRLAGDSPEAEHMRRAAEWIRAQGGLERARVFTHIWLAPFGLWDYSLLALGLRGYPLDHPVMRRGLEGLDAFTIDDPDGFQRLEACQSPVWDTALAIIALTDAGLEPDHPALLAAGDWLVAQEVRAQGDWAVRRPHLPPGGWAFEFANVNYPDVDDTTEVVLALRRLRHPHPWRIDEPVARGVRCALGMQSAGGGFGAFDADNTRELCRQLPFCDFGEVIDDPSADVTAHAIEMLAGEGMARVPAAQLAEIGRAHV